MESNPIKYNTGSMPAKIIDGKEIAKSVRTELRETLSSIGFSPRMAIVQVGEDEGSTTYSNSLMKSAEKLGIESEYHTIPAEENISKPLELMADLALNKSIHGILLQRPVPKPHSEIDIALLIPPEKDIDCSNPHTFGFLATGQPKMLPCTPAAIVEIMRRGGIETSGKKVAIVGRSNVVGKPLMLMLSAKGTGDATVTMCHTRTKNLSAELKAAEIVVAACGAPQLIKGDMISPGAVVIDAGINWVGDKMVGDVEFESVSEIAGFISPVPGGVGPVTRTMLFKNLLSGLK